MELSTFNSFIFNWNAFINDRQSDIFPCKRRTGIEYNIKSFNNEYHWVRNENFTEKWYKQIIRQYLNLKLQLSMHSNSTETNKEPLLKRRKLNNIFCNEIKENKFTNQWKGLIIIIQGIQGLGKTKLGKYICDILIKNKLNNKLFPNYLNRSVICITRYILGFK